MDVQELSNLFDTLLQPFIVKDNFDIKINFKRSLLKGSIESGAKGVKIKTLGKDGISINKENIDLRAVEQIVDQEQLNTIGYAMKYAEERLAGKGININEAADKLIEEMNKNIFAFDYSKGGNGSLAVPRKQEIVCAINRYRKLKIK